MPTDRPDDNLFDDTIEEQAAMAVAKNTAAGESTKPRSTSEMLASLPIRWKKADDATNESNFEPRTMVWSGAVANFLMSQQEARKAEQARYLRSLAL